MRREAPHSPSVGLFILPLVADSPLPVLSLWHVRQPHPIFFEKPRALGSWPYSQEQMYEGSASILVWVVTSYWFWSLETHDSH